MRRMIACFSCFALVCLGADWSTNVEYGKPNELKGVRSVYVWTTMENREAGTEVTRILRERLPALTIVETETDGDVCFAVQRREALPDPGNPGLHFVTTGSVIRPADDDMVRLLIEFVSREDDLDAALREITEDFANILCKYNRKKLGDPREDVTVGKMRLRSTAGLRPGLSKAEVVAAIGHPTRIHPKSGRTQAWWYETTSGTIRVVFAGDVVFHVEMIGK